MSRLSGLDFQQLALSVAERIALITSTEIAKYRVLGAEEIKDGRDLVTEADRRIESRLASVLRELLPGSVVRGEESRSETHRESEYEWVLDPIDGTVNFARGYEFYTSVVALLIGGRPHAAIVYHPESGQVVTAILNHGCLRIPLRGNGTAAGPATKMWVFPRQLHQTVYSIMITPKLSKAAQKASLTFAALTLEKTLGFRVLVSQAYEAVKLASGGINAVISFQSSGGWSRDAARLICEEAGGQFALLKHADGPERGFILVDSRKLLEQLIPLLAKVRYQLG